jgi:hypothetical protein
MPTVRPTLACTALLTALCIATAQAAPPMWRAEELPLLPGDGRITVMDINDQGYITAHGHRPGDTGKAIRGFVLVPVDAAAR